MNRPNPKRFLFLTLALLPLFAVSASSRTLFGIDILVKDDFETLTDANVALITNHTGVDRRGQSTVDLLHKAKNVNLICILTPEHGFRGNLGHGEAVADDRDPKTGVPIYSLYGKNSRPTSEMLESVDTLVFDIQDIGTRFYTYIATMGMALEEAALRGIRFVVLDRANPIRGDILEGDTLSPDIKRLTGYFPIPVRHGLTVGEIAHWMNETQGLDAYLEIIKLKGWKRSMWFDQVGRKFRPTSPNIPTLTAATLYPGIGAFEATNLSVGRGTESPFEIFGAPWINSEALVSELRQKNLFGFLFEPITFVPTSDIYEGQTCHGVKVRLTDRDEARPFQLFISAFLFLHKTYPEEFKPVWDELEIVTGSRLLEKAAQGRITPNELEKAYRQSQEKFWDEILPYHLY